MMTRESGSTSCDDRLRTLARRYGYAGILSGSLLVLWWGVEGPYPIATVANGLYVAVIVIVLGLEAWIPFTTRWGDVRDATRADVIYFLLAAPLDAVQVLAVNTLLAYTAGSQHAMRVFDVWPSRAPILLQLLLAMLVVDFFKYWYHRATHEVPVLWRMHSIHHSLNRLEMLRASYFYPIDILLTVGTGTLAMLALGASHELVIFHNVYAGITGLLNHSNADLRCGVLDVILNSPGHHRAHHSVGSPGSGSNYGSFFNFMDRLFGTRYLPQDQRCFDPLGLDASYEMPGTFAKQLAVPFRWSEVSGRRVPGDGRPSRDSEPRLPGSSVSPA